MLTRLGGQTVETPSLVIAFDNGAFRVPPTDAHGGWGGQHNTHFNSSPSLSPLVHWTAAANRNREAAASNANIGTESVTALS